MSAETPSERALVEGAKISQMPQRRRWCCAEFISILSLIQKCQYFSRQAVRCVATLLLSFVIRFLGRSIRYIEVCHMTQMKCITKQAIMTFTQRRVSADIPKICCNFTNIRTHTTLPLFPTVESCIAAENI